MRSGISWPIRVMVDVAWMLTRKILQECATQCDIENLDASANRQDWLIPELRRADEGDFPAVANIRHLSKFGVRPLAVQRRVDIRAAGQHQTVESLHEGAGRRGIGPVSYTHLTLPTI